MVALDRCSRCAGFRPAGQACPHCAAPPSRVARVLLAAGGGLALLTLSACYGPAARAVRPSEPEPETQGTPPVDGGAPR